VLGGHSELGLISTEARPRQSPLGHPLVLACSSIGLASLVGNGVWNCRTCGWDPDGVPWYQAVLVAGIPVLVAPAGVLLVLLRLLFLRTGRALVESVIAILGCLCLGSTSLARRGYTTASARDDESLRRRLNAIPSFRMVGG
jgi:hypothetical protein